MLDLEKKVRELRSSIKKLKLESASKESSAFARGQSEGLARGVQFCLRHLFHTSAGQLFLRDIHHGLLAAYKQSKLYMHEMGVHLSHFVKAGFKTA